MAACGLLLPALIGCGRGDPAGGVLASELHGEAFRIAPLDGGPAWSRVEMAEVAPEDCPGGEDPRRCLVYESRHRVAADGAAEVVVTWTAFDPTGSASDRENRAGRVAGLDPWDGTERWRLDTLDLSEVESACRPDPDDACRPAEEQDDAAFQACGLRQPHDVVVIGEDADGIAMWVADTRNARVLRILLEPGQTCGRVLDVVDRGRPDWDVYNSVNSLEVLDLDGATGLLMTVKDTFAGAQDGVQQGGDGRGKVLLWSDDGAWHQVWEWPPERTDEPSFVNSPHGVAWREGEGDPLVLFAHSLGRSDAWNDGSGGSVGVLSVGDHGPTYRYDLVLDPHPLRYTRDVRPLDDGTVLVADSGCKGGSEDCPWGSALWRVTLPEEPAPAVDGVWTADGERQHRVEVEPLGAPLLQGVDILYSAYEVPAP